MTQGEAGKREALNLRIKPQVRELIDRAAELAGKIIPKAYRQFPARLDAPPKPDRRLLKKMQTRAPWE